MPYGVNTDLLGNLGGKPATGADLANSSFQLGNSNANTEYARQKAGQYVAQELQKEKALSEAVAPFVNSELADNYIQQAMVDNYIRRQTAAAQPEQPRQGLLGGAPGQGYNQMSRELAQGLIQSKTIYDNGAAVFNNPNATDEQRAQAQGQMSQAQAMAASIRDTASQLGMNLDDYGSGVTLGQAQQNFQNADARALQSLLYGDGRGDNSAAKRAFQEARARGAGMADAYEMAQEAQARDRYQKLQDGFFTYGFDDNGAINHNGVRIAMEMAKTNPEMANFVMNAFPGAVQAYARDTQEKQAATKYAQDVDMLGRKTQATSALNAEKAAQSLQANLLVAQAKEALRREGKEYDRVSLAKFLVENGGLSPEEAVRLAAAGGKGGKSSGSSGSGSGGKPTAEEKKAANSMSTLFRDAMDAIYNERSSPEALAKAGDAITAFINASNDYIAKGIVDADDVTEIRNMQYKLNFLRAKLAGSEDEAAQYWQTMTPDFKDSDSALTQYMTNEERQEAGLPLKE